MKLKRSNFVIPQLCMSSLRVTCNYIFLFAEAHMDFRIDNMNISRHVIIHNCS